MLRHVTDGVYANNNISNIRIGMSGASISGVTAANETDPSSATWESREHDIMPRSGTEPESIVNCRGIWIENGSDILVEDVDIVMKVGRASAAIMIDSAVCEASVTNTRIHIESEECLYAVDVGAPKIDFEQTAVTYENVSITGYGGCEGAAVRIRGRPGSMVRNSYL